MSKHRRKNAFRLASEWTILWILGGFILAYFVYIPVTGDKVHSAHWLVSIGGGIIGYVIGIFIDNWLSPLLHFFRQNFYKTSVRPGTNKSTRKGNVTRRF